MARRRYVSTTISQDTRINKLALQYGDFAALLYTWMIPHAADDATLPGDPEELLYQVIPGRRDKSEADVQQALDGMAELGLIVATDDGRIMFPTAAFYRYQTYIKDRNKHVGEAAPTPPQNSATPEQATPRADNSAKQRKTAQKAVSFSPSPSFSLSPSPSLSEDVNSLRGEGGRGDAPTGADAPPPSDPIPIKRASRPERETRIPADFPISERMAAWAREKVPDLDLDYAHDEFCTYWRGDGGRKLDWEQTWQNGMLKAYERRRQASPRYGAQGQADMNSGHRRKFVGA